MREDLFSAYLQYTNNNECPAVFHRWSAIAAVGAMLGRNYSQPFGHQSIAPNIYCMLMGTPGTRKSTAIKIAKKLLQSAGYDTIAADKTTKEKFLLDLAGVGEDGNKSAEDFLAGNLDDSADSEGDVKQIFIMADEFNDFFGNNILEFVSLLGSLWDAEGAYKNRIKNSQSIIINNPTVSIIGGNTPTSFAHVFPPEVIGQGFFSRILLIHGETSRPKITFPTPPDIEETGKMLRLFQDLRIYCLNNVTRTSEAETMLDKIYRNWQQIDDTRFEYYGQRRFTHLLKLCSVHSAARSVWTKDSSAVITLEDVIAANTVLTSAEHGMPRALGEFGRNKNSDVTNTVMTILNKAHKPVKFADLYKDVSRDIGTIKDFAAVIQSLQVANKVQVVNGGYLPIVSAPKQLFKEAIDWSYLSAEERKHEQ